MNLAQIIANRIIASGPISVAEFMADALLHPALGYYATRDPLGVDGDFTTAPEISQMFGELIGLCMAQTWMDQGAPTDFILAELGPGRGTLMADILRATRNIPGFAPSVFMVEASPVLQAAQQDRLNGENITWIADVDDLPDHPLFVVANEFFDTLPIKQFQRDGAGWREICVGVDDDGLSFGLANRQDFPELRHRLEDTKDGDIVETCEAVQTVMRTLVDRISNHGGLGLIIDYGDWRSLGDTMQALKSHESVHPLSNVGQADITAHVDFEALTKAVSPALHTRVTPQGVFLERLGITERAQALAARLSDDARVSHIAAHRRLTHPTEMGNLFKVVGIYPDSAQPPPGLEP